MGYFSQAFHTTLNVVLYTLTFRRYLWMEGRRRLGRWRNWLFLYSQAAQWIQPTSIEEVQAAVRAHHSIRVVGAGHSFNAGILTEGVLLSLDRLDGLVSEPRQAGGLTLVDVYGGTRVRDVSRLLLERGLAIKALPSHDAQSIGGILSTDVHGTGREIGWVSSSVVGLKFVDGLGCLHAALAGDPLFRAAIGGIGAVGIIVQVTLCCVPAFLLDQCSEALPLLEAQRDHALTLQRNTHASYYVFPFSDVTIRNAWNPTAEPRSVLGPFRECVRTAVVSLSAAWLGEFLARTRLLPRFAGPALRLQGHSDLILQSHEGFNRTLYHMHQELEFTVPQDRVWDVAKKMLELYESMYAKATLPYLLIELRFTPDGHRQSWIGAGVEQASAWLNLCVNRSRGYERYYAEVERLLRDPTLGARPHLGKYGEQIDHTDLDRVHESRFREFLALRARHDPHGKFLNAFTRRVFGEIAEPANPAQPSSGPVA